MCDQHSNFIANISILRQIRFQTEKGLKIFYSLAHDCRHHTMANDKPVTVDVSSFQFKSSSTETGFVQQQLGFSSIFHILNFFLFFFCLYSNGVNAQHSLLLSVQHTETIDGKSKRVPLKLIGFNDSSSQFVTISSR